MATVSLYSCSKASHARKPEPSATVLAQSAGNHGSASALSTWEISIHTPIVIRYFQSVTFNPLPPIRYFRASQTPKTTAAIPRKANPVNASPNNSQASKAVVGGVR